VRAHEGAFDAILEAVRDTDATPWNDVDLGGVIHSALKAITITEAEAEAVKDRLQLAGQIARPLADKYVGNPRQVKRFLNTLMLRVQIARAYKLQGDVRLGPLAKLMLLERRDADAYTALSAAAATAKDGKVPWLNEIERSDATRVQDGSAPTLLEEHFGKRDSDWLGIWSRIEPMIGTLDLRPYFFVSREKLVDFVGGDALSAELQELVELLDSGKKIAVAGMKARFDALTREQAQQVFEAIVDRVRDSGAINTTPPSFKTINTLTTSRPELQVRFVRFLDSLPVTELGAWASTSVLSIATSVEAKGPANALIDRWGKQDDNAKLRQAARGAHQAVGV